MFLLSFARIIKFSFQDIFRNIWLTIVTVTILILALFTINILLVVKVISQTSIDAVKDRVDTSLYIKADANENDIIALKDKISNLPEVKEVKYISKAQALEIFKADYQDKPEVLQALRELGKNPLTPSLIIKPRSTDSVADFTNSLNNIQSDIIESRNFTDHKMLLDKINVITDKVNKVGIVISLIFIFITLLVVFNAVRVAIYTHRKEINIMKLVGASNSFVYMPFLLSGIIYSLVGVVVIILFFYPFLSLLQPYLEAFFVDYNINIIGYFNSNFIKIFGIEFLGMAVINIMASYIAVRKYVKV
jgi:cell division transport system permease protein